VVWKVWASPATLPDAVTLVDAAGVAVAGAAEPVTVAGLVAVPPEHAVRADKAATDMPPSSARRERN
jgi:hypothetical protein